MKLIVSGVTFSAAQTRSPSFSRSSSSMIIIIRPSRISAAAASIEENAIFDVFFRLVAPRKSFYPNNLKFIESRRWGSPGLTRVFLPSIGQDALDILSNDIGFKIHFIPGLQL